MDHISEHNRDEETVENQKRQAAGVCMKLEAIQRWTPPNRTDADMGSVLRNTFTSSSARKRLLDSLDDEERYFVLMNSKRRDKKKHFTQGGGRSSGH